MTTEWPEALRIADLFEVFGTNELAKKAAAELRRLHAANLDCMAWYEAIKSDYDRLKAEHEALLAACGVVAMADTPDSAKKARIMHPDYESASCDDVKRRVDECIELRARVAELEDVLTNLPLSSPQRMRARIQRLEEMLAAVGAGGVGPLIPATVQHQREPLTDQQEAAAFEAWWRTRQLETFPEDFDKSRLEGWAAAYKVDARKAWFARAAIERAHGVGGEA